MTTGRINQVTILDSRTRAHEDNPPKGAECSRQESRQSNPPNRPQDRYARHRVCRATDPIAPTEFPKVRSVAVQERPFSQRLARHIRPSGGENPRFVTHARHGY